MTDSISSHRTADDHISVIYVIPREPAEDTRNQTVVDNHSQGDSQEHEGELQVKKYGEFTVAEMLLLLSGEVIDVAYFSLQVWNEDQGIPGQWR